MPTNNGSDPFELNWVDVMPPSAPSIGLSGATATQQTFSSVVKKYGRRGRPAPSVDSAVPLIPKAGFTFGCDPEGFVFNKKTGKPVPAVGLIPGTKQSPHPVDKGAIQVDGMAVEFNINPAATYDEWEDNITSVIKQLEAALPKGLEIRWVPSVRFPEDAFDAAPENAKELGCDPDFDAWTGGTNRPPMLDDPYVRCAGGHLHFGWTKDEDLSDLQHLLNCQDLGKQSDWFLGGWSVFKDEDKVRRSLYGKMGAIRYKPYGVEYRVLSNFWVPDKGLRREVWDRMVTAVDQVSNYFLPERANKKMTDWLRDAINNHKIIQDLPYLAEYPLMSLNMGLARI